MSYNKSPFAFDDIRSAFERALEAPKGIKLVCDSHSAAILLRSRFNYYRKMHRRENSEVYQPGDPMYGKSVYDRLILRVPKKGNTDANILYIEPHVLKAEIEEIT